MNKKFILTVIFCSIVFLGLLKYWSGVKTENLSRDQYIEQLIIKSINIQYRGGDEEKLNGIFTSDFITKISENPHFYKNKIFYTIDKNFMDSYRELNEYQATVSVRVEDTSGSYIQIVTLIKDPYGDYKISRIEFDL